MTARYRTALVAVALLSAGATGGVAFAAEKKPVAPAAAPELVILGGRVLSVSDAPIDNGAVLIREGKIIEVGESVKSGPRAVRIDAKGKTVIPGMIDAYTRAGLIEVSLVAATVDDDEGTDPITPQVRALDAFNPLSRSVSYAREHGITTALIAPRAGSDEVNVVAGQSAVVRLLGSSADRMTLRAPAALHVSLGEGPKNRFRGRKKAPVSRMGEVALLRSALIDGREYSEARKRHEAKGGGAGAPARDLRREAMAEAVVGRLPVFIHCHRADDILTALRLREEFGLNLVLVHATEGIKVASQIARAGVPVVVGPVSTIPERMETLEASPETAAALARAGVKIAITTASSHLVSHLPYEAALAASAGLPEDQALRAITLGAAEILGIADRLGSIEPGKEADLVIVGGDPLEITSPVEWVIVGGEVVYRRGA